MHDTRNLVLVILTIAAGAWAFVAMFMLGPDTPVLLVHRIASLLLLLCGAAWLVYAFKFEDRLEDHLAEVTGSVYYDADGLSFMPVVRLVQGEAELCVYYQNRYENPVEAIIHLRPPADSFIIRPGMHDVRFAFMAKGGDFGVIHQRIAVPEHLKGEVIDVQLAAASWYPRSHGTRLRKQAGMGCGGFNVDWGGAAFRTGVHEGSGEIELIGPAMIHLSMPRKASSEMRASTWRQERLAAEEVDRLQRVTA